MYFNYNNPFIKNVIYNNICKYDTLAYWWIQTVNFDNDGVAVSVTDCPKKNESDCITTSKKRKEGYICKLKHNTSNKTQNNTVGYCGILQRLFKQLSYIECKILSEDFMMNKMIDYLLLGYNFNIKSLKQTLINLIYQNPLFQHDICYRDHSIL